MPVYDYILGDDNRRSMIASFISIFYSSYLIPNPFSVSFNFTVWTTLHCVNNNCIHLFTWQYKRIPGYQDQE